jgi:DNA-binding transcriptional LysR family regulator
VNSRANPETDLDVRSLRYFVAVAEELHFTRAAARLFVAQQALSRDIQRLETQLGAQLFVRTTRRVSLTPEGQQLLTAARELIRVHDQLVVEVREPTRPVIVDLMSEGRQTGARVLEAARAIAPRIEFRGRHGGAMGASMRRLQAAELDAAFGRAQWRGQRDRSAVESELLRFEPLALLLPMDHPLTAWDAVPVEALAGTEIDANPAHPDALEWSDLAGQFLEFAGARPTPEHVSAIGPDDQAHHLVQQGLPILSSADHTDVPGGAVRPIVDPVPYYCWSIAWRSGSHPAGLSAIREAARTLRDENDWLELPEGAWLPEPEASTVGA